MKTAEHCTQYVPDEIVDVKSIKQSRIEGCGKILSFGVVGTKPAKYCSQHAPDGMVDACSRECRTGGCGKYPSFAVTHTRTAEYCAHHARLQCGVEHTGKAILSHNTSGKKPLETLFRVVLKIKPFILLPPRQAFRRVLAGTVVCEYDIQILRVRLQSELCHEARLEERGLCRISRSKNLPSNEILLSRRRCNSACSQVHYT